jgi:hypothetical protein
MTKTSMPKVDAGGEGGWARGGCGRGVHRVELVGRAVTLVQNRPVRASFTEKPAASNLTEIGFSRVSWRTETRLLTKLGQTSTLDILMGVDVEGKDILPTCVMGKEEPSPTVMRVEVWTGVEEVRLPG